MLTETFSEEEKLNIARSIKPIQHKKIQDEWNKLVTIGQNAHECSSRCRTGLNILDFFTFEERLETKGKYNVNYFEFISNIDEFKRKRFIANMLDYYKITKNKNMKKNEYIVYKEVYNICISAINAFRPVVAMEIYALCNPRCILDFCSGWGGRLIGACALNVEKYIGIDINTNLTSGYNNMQKFLEERSTTTIEMHFKDALEIDYSKLVYDMVFTSPPYYFIEKYSNNTEYENKRVMKESFYEPLFTRTYDNMQVGGHYCLNVNREIYEDICIHLFGVPYKIIPLKKSQRQNKYTENIYIWLKPHTINPITV